MFIFRQGGREGRTAARHCYSEGTFLFLQNLANFVQNLQKALMHEDGEYWNLERKNWKLVAIR
jgi:hypothetical protein